MTNELVLSLFPGLGMLDASFEREGFTTLRGPDPLWGGDVRRFSMPGGVVSGVIGGPPCQPFSRLVHMVRANGYTPRHENLIPEFERVTFEAQPDWFLMEEAPEAPAPVVAGYMVKSGLLNNRWFGGEQSRQRRISFGTRDGRSLWLEPTLFDALVWEPAVTSHSSPTPVAMVKGGGRKSTADRPPRTLAEMLRLQGFPEDWLDESPFTDGAKKRLVGNGVPMNLGRAIARGVRHAMNLPLVGMEAVS